MTEKEIPADVMEAARRARKKFADEAMNLPVWDGTDLIAAHAIMAERERCAKIADDIGNLERGERAHTAEHIAREIRGAP